MKKFKIMKKKKKIHMPSQGRSNIKKQAKYLRIRDDKEEEEEDA